MILLLSPAKSLDFESKPHIAENSQPEFVIESHYLIKKLKKLSAKQLGTLMNISADLSDLNHCGLSFKLLRYMLCYGV